jgi:hypothetical protein
MQTATKRLQVKVSDNLTPATDLPKSKVERITEKYLKGAKLEYFNSNLEKPLVFDDDFQNQYIAALHTAFAEHYAFILNPDDIWQLILQGLSIHINQNSEKYRDVLVDFKGKKEIVVRHDGLVQGDQNNTWSKVFPVFEESIAGLIKNADLAKYIVPEFSTTTELDKTCFRISLMDITKSYFSFVVMTKCGIPVINIDGIKEDWLQILGNIQALLPLFEMQEWADKLSNIICKIVSVYDGIEDKKFFDSIYKYQSMSGGDRVSGWITEFFPYIVKNEGSGKNGKSELVKHEGPYFKTACFPSSISSVPFVWEYLGQKFNMNFFAGFCGFDETDSEAIRPRKNFFIAYEK